MSAEEFKHRFLPLHARLYRTAYHLMGNVMDAEDIVQEAYMKLWEQRTKLKNINNVEAYCTCLIRNLCIDKLRRQSPEEEELIVEKQFLSDSDIGTTLERKDEINQLQNLISHLPDGQRTVMILHDIEECSYEEIEKATGFTAINIRVMLSRARKKIREQFEQIINYGQR